MENIAYNYILIFRIFILTTCNNFYRTTDNLYTVETLEVPPALVTTLKEKLNSSCIQDNQLAFLIAKQLL